jgi:hypothetical protein
MIHLFATGPGLRRMTLPLLGAVLAVRAMALPALPEGMDPTRVLSATPVLKGSPLLDTRALGPDATTVDWAPGELWRMELRDGSQRFVVAGAQEREAEGRLLLPRQSLWLEVPPTGDVRVVVESLTLQPMDGVRMALGREESLAGQASDGDRQVLDAGHSRAMGQARDDAFSKPVLLGEPVIFRDLRMVPISLQPVILHQGKAQAVVSLGLRLEYGEPAMATPSPLDWCAEAPVRGNELRGARSWSGNMESVYRSLVPNHGQFYDAVDESVFPVYLITGSPNYLGGGNPGMDEFIKWKREKGFDVRVVPFDEIPGGGTSISFGALRDWMRGQWQSLRPEYLLLVGDVDGTTACPDSVVQAHTGDYDVSDHFYALQEGEDYFPELFVGRFSVDNAQQLYVMAEKHVIHEKAPNLSGSLDWLTKGLVVSCNYSDTGTPPISPNQTSRWVIDKLRANGFTITSQDSIFYPPTTDGGSQINAAINQGRGIVSYRGWANSNGWIYPAYDRDDVEALTNYMRMPVMGSFVCQTGAFGQGSGDVVVEDPCFGEKITRLGNPGLPRGCVAFVGPSDLHTRTQYNNPVCSGFFNAIFDLGMTSIGPALNNGKMELYTGYPLEREDRFSSYFYFHIYNVLGDANLKIWRSQPTALTLEAPAAILPGQGVLELDVLGPGGQPKDGVLVTLTGGLDGSLLLARGATTNGHLLLDLDPAQLSPGLLLTLTTEHVDHLPAQLTLSVGNVQEALELTGLDVAEEVADGQYRAGEVLDVRLHLRNAGSGAVAAGTATLRDPSQWDVLPDWFTIENGSLATPALSAGADATSVDAFRIRLAEDAPNAGVLHLVADVAAGGYSGVVDGRLPVSNLALELVTASWRSGADQLFIDQRDTLDVTLRNSGAYDLPGAVLSLLSSDTRVVVVAGAADLPALPREASTQLSFALEGGVGLFPGQAVSVRLEALDGVRRALLDLPLPIGTLAPQDPFGPDAHGYYAVESGDYDVQGHPQYDWLELDPVYGGSGATRLMLGDDGVTTVDLPFPITHYGRSSSRLSICSNGWVSLGDTWIDDFRNWNLPSSLGPPNLIAAYWDDLKPHYPDSSYVPVFWRHDAAEGRVVVSWSRAYNRYAWENTGQPLQELELVLYDQSVRPTPTGDTEILVQWKQVTDLDQNNNYATCGMENFGHDIGLQVSYANQPSPGCAGFGPGRAVLFTTRQPIHDSSFRVDVQEPRQQQWLNNASPVLRWDHDSFVQRLAAGGVSYQSLSYELSLSTDTELLFTATATGATYDLAANGHSLPEGRELRLEIRALVDATSYPSLQGVVVFHVDATSPSLTPALLSASLYPGHLEVGVLASETLASLRVEALAGDAQVLFTLQQDPGLVALSGGQELRYLRAQLQEGVSTLRLTAEDAHGLESVVTLPLAALPFTEGRLSMPEMAGLELEWQGGQDWAVALGRKDAPDARLLAMGAGRAVDIHLPSNNAQATLRVDAEAGLVLVSQRNGVWRTLPQERVGSGIEARLEHDGLVGLMAEGSVEEMLPADFQVVGNHPNPFNPETWIRFQLPAEGAVQVDIHNLAGALVRRLATGQLAAGTHDLRWDGRNDAGLPAASGVYLVQVEWQGRTDIHRMLMLR